MGVIGVSAQDHAEFLSRPGEEISAEQPHPFWDNPFDRFGDTQREKLEWGRAGAQSQFANVGEFLKDHDLLGNPLPRGPDTNQPFAEGADSIGGSAADDLDQHRRQALDDFITGRLAASAESAQEARAWHVDPATRSGSANMIADLAGMFTQYGTAELAAGPLSPGIVYEGSRLEAYDQFRQQGLSNDDAAKAANLEGLFAAAMARAPIAVRGGWKTRVLTGAGIGAAYGASHRGVLGMYLNSMGYHDLAQQYHWLDAHQMTVDALFGGAFGGVFGHRGERVPTRLRRAAAVEADTLHEEFGVAPGMPVDEEAANAHAAAMRTARDQAAADEPIDVASSGVEDEEFVPFEDHLAVAAEIDHARRVAQDTNDTLTRWVRTRGGISDDRGDIAGGAGDNQRGFARLLRPGGETIDDLAIAAWEDGFFSEVPSRTEFIDALNEDAAGRRRDDSGTQHQVQQARDVLHYWEAQGVDTSLRGQALREHVRDHLREQQAQEFKGILDQYASDIGVDKALADWHADRAHALGREIDIGDDAHFSFAGGARRRPRSVSEVNASGSSEEQAGDITRIPAPERGNLPDRVVAAMEHLRARGETPGHKRVAALAHTTPGSVKVVLSQLHSGKHARRTRPDLADRIEALRSYRAEMVSARQARDIRILELLQELNPSRRRQPGRIQSDRSHSAIAARMRAEGFEGVTKSVVSGVAHRFPPDEAASEASIARTAAELGIPESRVRQISAARRAGDARYSAGPTQPLVAIHNTVSKKLLHAVRMGGLAAPSLAVTRADLGFENFGDITLVAKPELVAPRSGARSRVFNADIYSPRYPAISHKVNERTFRRLIERPLFQEASRDLGFKMSSELDESTTRREGIDAVLNSTVVQLAYARAHDIRVDIPTERDFNGKDRPDYYAVRRDLAQRVGETTEFMEWAEKEFSSAFEGERIFQGWSYSGRARYLPHNLDTVVRLLKRDIRGGEGFNYGVGSIRSKVAREFSSLAAIKRARSNIIAHEPMEAIKKEAETEFLGLAERFVAKTGRVSAREQLGFLDTFSEHLKEVAETGRASSMDQYYSTALTAEDHKLVTDFLDRLRDLPTEYFEAKISRAVQLGEFAAAVVPEGTEQRTLTALREAGVTDIRTYPKSDVQARRETVQQVASDHGALFARGAHQTEGFSSVEDLHAAAEDFLGTDWQSIADAGGIEVAASADQITNRRLRRFLMSGRGSEVRAVHMKSEGRTYFIADRINAGSLRGLILHEIGVHHGMEDMLGVRAFKALLAQIERMVKAGHPLALEARDWARTFAAHADHIPEETLAYSVQFAPDSPIVTSLLAKVRQWLLKTFGSTFGMRLTVDDIRELALSSIRRVAEQARRASNDAVEVAPMGDYFASKAPDAGGGGEGQRVAYRGLSKPYDPANGGYYQSFTSSEADARDYGQHVMAAHLSPGRNLAVDGGGNNFNALSVSQLPADVRARLHPGAGSAASTDQIAHAAREAGYDSVTVRNVHDNRWGERPAAGAAPRTIDFVFDTKNISPLDHVPSQPIEGAGAPGKVRLSGADRALLSELEAPPQRPDGGNAAAIEGDVLPPSRDLQAPRRQLSEAEVLDGLRQGLPLMADAIDQHIRSIDAILDAPDIRRVDGRFQLFNAKTGEAGPTFDTFAEADKAVVAAIDARLAKPAETSALPAEGENTGEHAPSQDSEFPKFSFAPRRKWLTAAVRDPETGEIYTGDNHAEAAGEAPEDVMDRNADEWFSGQSVNSGFVTADGEFLTRGQAEAYLNARVNRGRNPQNVLESDHGRNADVDRPARESALLGPPTKASQYARTSYGDSPDGRGGAYRSGHGDLPLAADSGWRRPIPDNAASRRGDGKAYFDALELSPQDRNARAEIIRPLLGDTAPMAERLDEGEASEYYHPLKGFMALAGKERMELRRYTLDVPTLAHRSWDRAFDPDRTYLSFEVGPDWAMLHEAHTAAELRGAGVGAQLHMDAIDSLTAEGKRVFSDASMSDDAMRLWRETLPKLGYEVRATGSKVERSPITGQINTVDGRAHFEVLARKDAPTLDQMREAEARQARQEAYDKLDPADQKLADDPDAEMKFSMAGGEEPKKIVQLRKLRALAKAEEKAASEMRKGVEAAARCGARYVGEGASFITMRATAEAAFAAQVGHGIGALYSVPLGIMLAPLVARYGSQQDFSAPESELPPYAPMSPHDYAEAQQAAQRMGLDMPSADLVGRDVPVTSLHQRQHIPHLAGYRPQPSMDGAPEPDAGQAPGINAQGQYVPPEPASRNEPGDQEAPRFFEGGGGPGGEEEE